MKTASQDFIAHAVAGDIPSIRAVITQAGGSTTNVLPEDFRSVSFSWGTSSPGSFDIGSAVIGTFNFSLNNQGGGYSLIDYRGAYIDAYIFYDAGDEIPMGRYYFARHKAVNSLIVCETYDGLKLCDECMLGDMTWPCTAEDIVDSICTAHDWEWTGSFGNKTLQIIPVNTGQKMTERQALAYVGQITGNYIRMDASGDLCVDWYDTSNPYVPAGILSGPSISTTDITITGVRVGECLRGSDRGYVVEIKDNPFVITSREIEIADALASRVVGTTFRPGDAGILSYPPLDAGDAIRVTDIQGNTAVMIVTSLRYKLSLLENIDCDYGNTEEMTDLRPSVNSDIQAAIYDAFDLVYDHMYTESNGVYTFTAYLYRGLEDITSRVDPDHFVWFLRTEDGDSLLGYGRTITINKSALGYRASIIGGYDEVMVANIITSDGDHEATSSGDLITTYAIGEV